MLPTNFYLFQSESGASIRDHRSMLMINIHLLEDREFQPNPSELQFYSIYGGKQMAFETVDIKGYLRPLVASALLWYAQHVGYPDMHISSQDPRTSLKAG